MEYRFLSSGESPEFGRYNAGDIKELPKTIGDILIKRGLVEEVKPTKTAKADNKEA